MNLLRRLLGEMETPRLVLRHWRESDLEDFLAFAADPAVMLDSGARPATTFEEEQTFFRRALWDSGCYAICLRENDRPIGYLHVDDGESHDLGYALARPSWGRGYMTEALAAMVRCAFERKHVDVLAIGHFQGNHRSRRVIEKCGFQYEGTIRQGFRRYDGQVFDDVCYSILKEEYFAHPQRFQPQAVKIPKDFEKEG